MIGGGCMVNKLKNYDQIINEKDYQIDVLNKKLANEKQINNKTREYLLLLESKVAESERQMEIIDSLNSQFNQLKKEMDDKDNEIEALKKELEATKLTEQYIVKMLDLKRDIDEI